MALTGGSGAHGGVGGVALRVVHVLVDGDGVRWPQQELRLRARQRGARARRRARAAALAVHRLRSGHQQRDVKLVPNKRRLGSVFRRPDLRRCDEACSGPD